MIRDINYQETAGNRTIALTTLQDTPEILKRAITLMLFSKDPDIRNFNGRSAATAFPTITQAGFPAVNFYLTLAAKRIQTILSTMYDNIESVYFEAVDDAPRIAVTLNVKLTAEDSPLTQMVFSE